MGICRDVFGKLCYTATSSDHKVFSVTRGENCIIEHRPYLRANAAIMIDSEMAFWEDTPQFESFIKAVSYLKTNLENLL